MTFCAGCMDSVKPIINMMKRERTAMQYYRK
jgi:hypothetical protein